jgi:hypothetical protein
MVAKTVRKYTKDHPYDLRWRFEFDETLLSVCNIGGNKYDPNNLSEEEKKEIEEEFGYLRSLKDFMERTEFLSESKKAVFSKADPKCTHIDYVNLAWVNPDKKTYSFKQFWETSDGTRILDNEGDKCQLSEEGLFDFIDDAMNDDYTQIVENGKVATDWKTYFVKGGTIGCFGYGIWNEVEEKPDKSEVER